MIKILIVADVRIHRRGYRSLLERIGGIEILGACTREDAPGQVLAKLPDVVLLDVTTDGRPTVIKDIIASTPRVKVICVGVEDAKEPILSSIELGASEVVTDHAGEAELVSAITDVTSSGFHYPVRILDLIIERLREWADSRDASKPGVGLTPREREIADLVKLRYSNKEIAQALSIEPSTVKNHVHSILQKTHVHRRAKAVAELD